MKSAGRMSAACHTCNLPDHPQLAGSRQFLQLAAHGILEEPGPLPVQLTIADGKWLLIVAAAPLAGIGIIASALRLPWQTSPWLSFVGE